MLNMEKRLVDTIVEKLKGASAPLVKRLDDTNELLRDIRDELKALNRRPPR